MCDVLFGTAPCCGVVAVSSLMTCRIPGAAYLFAGSLLYLVGTIVVTFVFNVPRNEALAAAAPDGADAAELWTRYLAEWTAWNHVRAAAALLAAALLILALC